MSSLNKTQKKVGRPQVYTPCTPKQIRDKKTKKCRTKKAVGRPRKYAPCTPTQIRDKKTKKCRTKKAVGRPKKSPSSPKKTLPKKKLPKKTSQTTKGDNKDRILSICVPKKFEELANKCACKKQWLIKSKGLGKGAYGKVYAACLVGDCRYAVKIQKYDEMGEAEVNAYMHFEAQKMRVGPKFYAAWVCRGKLYIVLERLKCDFKSFHTVPRKRLECDCFKNREASMHKVQELLNALEKKGWLHGDIHLGNVMCTQDDRMVLIDYNFAVKKGTTPHYVLQGFPHTYEAMKKRQEHTMIDLTKWARAEDKEEESDRVFVNGK